MTQTDPGSARSLINLAREAELRGDTTRSLQLYDDALTLLEDETDLPLLADALRWKGTLHREQGETEMAHGCYKQSLIHAELCGSLNCRAHAYNCLAIIAQRRGNLAETEQLYAQASELAAKAGGRAAPGHDRTEPRRPAEHARELCRRGSPILQQPQRI